MPSDGPGVNGLGLSTVLLSTSENGGAEWTIDRSIREGGTVGRPYTKCMSEGNNGGTSCSTARTCTTDCGDVVLSDEGLSVF